MKHYRVCLADENLNQVTYWEWLDDNDRVGWPEGLVFGPTIVYHYLIHDAITDTIRICDLDTPAVVRKESTLHLDLGNIESTSRWLKRREVSPD